MNPLRVAVLCDFAEENWPSMEVVAGMLLERINVGHRNIGATRIQPAMKPRFRRWLRSANAFNADRLIARHWDYPRLTPSLKTFDLFHVIDHSYAQLVHRLPRERTLVTCHDTDTFRCLFQPADERRPYWFRVMARRTLSGLRRAGAILCVSEATKQQLVQHGVVPQQRLHVVHNGVHPCFRREPDPYRDDAAEELLGPRGKVAELLHVGSTIPRKRIDVLLTVFAGCRAESPGLRLVHVGAPFTSAQANLIQVLGIENDVVSVPHLTTPLLAAVYRRATLTLLPSEAEGFGLPLVESMACGTPVIASDIPSLREVGGRAAEYCPMGAVDHWIAVVTRFLKSCRENDPVWERRKEKSVQEASRFSWERNAAETVAIYRGMLGRNGSENEV